jgi:hypothetical protein
MSSEQLAHHSCSVVEHTLEECDLTFAWRASAMNRGVSVLCIELNQSEEVNKGILSKKSYVTKRIATENYRGT